MKDKNKILNKISDALNANDLETARKLIENDLKRVGSKEEYYFYLALISKDLNKKLELYMLYFPEQERTEYGEVSLAGRENFRISITFNVINYRICS